MINTTPTIDPTVAPAMRAVGSKKLSEFVSGGEGAEPKDGIGKIAVGPNPGIPVGSAPPGVEF